MSALGFIAAGTIGQAEVALFRPQGSRRAIGAFTAQVTIEERHSDDLEITEHPVDQGAMIADHAFKRPAVVVIRASWSASPASASLANSLLSGVEAGALGAVGLSQAASLLQSGSEPVDLSAIYANLLKLQSDVTLIDIITGKRAYRDMLISSVAVETTVKTENTLMATLTCRQVIRVASHVVTISASAANQQFQHSTAPILNNGTVQLQPAPSYNGAP